MTLIAELKKLLSRPTRVQGLDDSHKCPCCSREMVYFPHMNPIPGHNTAPRLVSWGCIFCGR